MEPYVQLLKFYKIGGSLTKEIVKYNFDDFKRNIDNLMITLETKIDDKFFHSGTVLDHTNNHHNLNFIRRICTSVTQHEDVYNNLKTEWEQNLDVLLFRNHDIFKNLNFPSKSYQYIMDADDITNSGDERVIDVNIYVDKDGDDIIVRRKLTQNLISWVFNKNLEEYKLSLII